MPDSIPRPPPRPYLRRGCGLRASDSGATSRRYVPPGGFVASGSGGNGEKGAVALAWARVPPPKTAAVPPPPPPPLSPVLVPPSPQPLVVSAEEVVREVVEVGRAAAVVSSSALKLPPPPPAPPRKPKPARSPPASSSTAACRTLRAELAAVKASATATAAEAAAAARRAKAAAGRAAAAAAGLRERCGELAAEVARLRGENTSLVQRRSSKSGGRAATEEAPLPPASTTPTPHNHPHPHPRPAPPPDPAAARAAADAALGWGVPPPPSAAAAPPGEASQAQAAGGQASAAPGTHPWAPDPAHPGARSQVRTWPDGRRAVRRVLESSADDGDNATPAYTITLTHPGGLEVTAFPGGGARRASPGGRVEWWHPGSGEGKGGRAGGTWHTAPPPGTAAHGSIYHYPSGQVEVYWGGRDAWLADGTHGGRDVWLPPPGAEPPGGGQQRGAGGGGWTIVSVSGEGVEVGRRVLGAGVAAPPPRPREAPSVAAVWGGVAW